jgi:hypothetical protein
VHEYTLATIWLFMHTEKEEQSQRQPVERNWLIHAVIITWCLLAVSTEHWWPGWSAAIAVGGAVPGLVVRGLRRLWHEVWFWVAVVIMTALQAPLMLHVQPYMVRLKLLFIFPFAVADLLAFGIVIQCVALVCSRDTALH